MCNTVGNGEYDSWRRLPLYKQYHRSLFKQVGSTFSLSKYFTLHSEHRLTLLTCLPASPCAPLTALWKTKCILIDLKPIHIGNIGNCLHVITNSDIICRQAASSLQTPPKVGALLVVAGAWRGAGLGSTLQCQWSAGSEQ